MKYPLIGNHPSIQKVRELVTMVSDLAMNVLLLGETGTGKEVIARLLHSTSSRRNNRFVKVNCAALPLTLLESELFGHEKGAFTGANKFKPGKFEQATDGVILLDEIGDMPPSLQAKLLNVLQSGEYNRLGGTKNVKVNAWVISATNHDLEKDMKQGLFREDLYYRLNIIRIDMPPLRDRKEDIPLLTEYFIRKNQIELKLNNNFTLNSQLKELFDIYTWPGNVRELSSTVLRLMLEDTPEQIIREMEKGMDSEGFPTPLEKNLDTSEGSANNQDNKVQDKPESLKIIKADSARYIEKRTITHVLNETRWNKREAARLLNISYRTLFYKMEQLGIAQSLKKSRL